MVLVSFSSELIKDAHLLSQLDSNVFHEFVTFALNNLNGQKASPKIFARVGASLGVAPDVVQKAIFALAAVLVESAKKNATEKDFTGAVCDLALSSENAQYLTETYVKHAASLRSDLSKVTLSQTTYHSVDWRLDVEVGSRALRNEIKPTFVLALETQNPGMGKQTQMLQADFGALQHIADELQRAVAEGKNNHARRIQRYVK